MHMNRSDPTQFKLLQQQLSLWNSDYAIITTKEVGSVY